MRRPNRPLQLPTPAPLRGEIKLAAALKHFEVEVQGRIALDIGASTGGFTRALLAAGARRVYAVDVGHGQLLGSLRQDDRVINLEATNVGVLNSSLVPESPEIVTVDVSYLSLGAAVTQVSERLPLAHGAVLLGLVKPMFELRLGTAPHDESTLARATDLATAGLEAAGWRERDRMVSPVRGARGAIEGFIHATWTGDRI